ncbi:MAG TPA: DUF5666 domain-containing protein [Candidatus Angelobacter sp.]|nr:DUF5666 domain-containing protein [Candidatus Angelobacter sp.]
MISMLFSFPPRKRALLPAVTFNLLLFAIVFIAAGCGNGGSIPTKSSAPTPTPTPGGNAQVALVVSSTADDQVSEFDLLIKSIVLTNQAGATVTLLDSPQSLEFIHLNGTAEPLLSASIPQGVYTAASMALDIGAPVDAVFICVGLDSSGSVSGSLFGGGAANVAAVLPAPLVVNEDTMGLSLNLLVSRSAITPGSCINPSGATFTISPTFSLATFDIPPLTAKAAPDQVVSLLGKIVTIDSGAGTFQVTLPEGLGQPAPLVPIRVDSGTVFQGISGFASLSIGFFVNLDGRIQADGSVQATRIDVRDPSALNFPRGPVLFVDGNAHEILVMPRQEQGKASSNTLNFSDQEFDYSGAAFDISGQFSNIQALPFSANFSGSTIVPGQVVSVSSPVFADPSQGFTPATTVTLMPQTVNGTVMGSTSQGGFTVLTVAIPSASLFSALATQPAQTSFLQNPNAVEVYIDNNTQMLNSTPLTQNAPFRFYGLVFNDNGVLRMDCSKVLDAP